VCRFHPLPEETSANTAAQRNDRAIADKPTSDPLDPNGADAFGAELAMLHACRRV
jgi:hypothetical protein